MRLLNDDSFIRAMKADSLRFSKLIGDEYDILCKLWGKAFLEDTTIGLGGDGLSANDPSNGAIRSFNTNEERDEYYDMLIYIIDNTIKFLKEKGY